MILNNLTPGGTCGAGRCSQVYTVNIYPKEDYSIRQNIYAVFQTRAIHLKLTTFYSSLQSCPFYFHGAKFILVIQNILKICYMLSQIKKDIKLIFKKTEKQRTFVYRCVSKQQKILNHNSCNFYFIHFSGNSFYMRTNIKKFLQF